MQNKIGIFCCLSIMLINISCNGKAQNLDINGEYDGILHLAYNKTNSQLTGFVSYNPYEGNASAVQISCKFFFIGDLSSNSLKNYCAIKIYPLLDDSLYSMVGSIKVDSNRAYLKMGEDYAACTSVLDFNDNRGAEFFLSKRRVYNSFNFISSDRAIIYSSPSDTSKTKMYLVRNDIINVLETKGKFVLMEFYGKKTVKGWIQSDNLFTNSQ